jgi:hypothetical protein
MISSADRDKSGPSSSSSSSYNSAWWVHQFCTFVLSRVICNITTMPFSVEISNTATRSVYYAVAFILTWANKIPANATSASYSGRSIVPRAPSMQRRMPRRDPRDVIFRDDSRPARQRLRSTPSSVRVRTSLVGGTIVVSPSRLAGVDIDDALDGEASLSEPAHASGDDGPDSRAGRCAFRSPVHSESFLLHLEGVRSSWPHDASDESHREHDVYDIGRLGDGGGVPCEGEPSIDPSRTMRGAFDGEYDWI